MSLLTPDPGLLFWMLLCFLVVAFILGKWGWPAIVGMIEERGNYIEESLKKADEANAALANIKEEAAKLLSDAKNERLEMLKEASRLKDQMISDAKTQAVAEANNANFMLTERGGVVLNYDDAASRRTVEQCYRKRKHLIGKG